MKQIDPSPNNPSGGGWHILGELELPVGAKAGSMVSAWLAETLAPLNLHADFLTKVLKSAQDAAARSMRSEIAEVEFDHIHLLVFAPGDRASRGQNWGFFRVEKLENTTTDKTAPDHAIEFYLYLEG